MSDQWRPSLISQLTKLTPDLSDDSIELIGDSDVPSLFATLPEGLHVLQNPENGGTKADHLKGALDAAKQLSYYDSNVQLGRGWQMEGAKVTCALLDITLLLHTRTAWQGLKGVLDVSEAVEDSSKVHLDPLCNAGIHKKVEEDSWVYLPLDKTRAQVVTDKLNRVVIVRCKRPDISWSAPIEGVGKSWDEVVEGVWDTISAFEEEYGDNLKVLDYNRGDFKSLHFGTHHGTMKQPGKFSMTPTEEHLLQEFCRNPYVVTYADAVAENFRCWYPKEAVLYSAAQLRLLAIDGLVSTYFPNVQFAAATMNFGKKTVVLPHKDLLNLIFGICTVGAFGRFDPKRSAQLLFLEAKTIMEVGHGDMVLFPSAAFTHENTAVQNHESRSSLVFYTGAALFRWIASGHWNGVQFDDKSSRERLAQGWGLLSTMAELNELYSN